MKNNFVPALAGIMFILTLASCQKDSNIALKDMDGNNYATVLIGKQIWMAQNLNVATYRNGDPIPEIKDQAEWGAATKGAWCFYKNESSKGIIYGRIYNWYAVNDPRGLAPAGWHVPNDDEWLSLANSLGGESVAGGAMKTTGTLQAGNGLWLAPNVGATNNSGFTAIPAGYRNADGNFGPEETGVALWWSSTNVAANQNGPCPTFSVSNDGTILLHIIGFPLTNGFSVRCVKD